MFNFDKPVLHQCPTGRWIFVGRVPVALGYVQQNGNAPTPRQAEAAAQCGPGIAGLRPRTWETKEEAEQALSDYIKLVYEDKPVIL